MTTPLVLTRPRRPAPPEQRTRRGPAPVAAAAVPAEDTDRIAATAKSLAIACLEIFAGVRRAETIARWVEPELLERIERRARLRAEIAPIRQTSGHPGAQALQAGAARVCRVAVSVAEVTVMVRTQRRVRAVAVRLELAANRWTMTALETM